MAVALGGLGLVVAAHGSEHSRPDAVTIESSEGSPSDGGGSVVAGGDSATFGAFGTNLQHIVNDQSIRLLDFGEVDQPSDACSGGPVATPQVISVTGGESAVLDRDHQPQTAECDGHQAQLTSSHERRTLLVGM